MNSLKTVAFLAASVLALATLNALNAAPEEKAQDDSKQMQECMKSGKTHNQCMAEHKRMQECMKKEKDHEKCEHGTSHDHSHSH
jgi:uncharacterized protein involved in copper resistance